MPDSLVDPYDRGTGPTLRAIKAAFIAKKMKIYGKLPNPRLVESWLDEFGAMSKRQKLNFYNRLSFKEPAP